MPNERNKRDSTGVIPILHSWWLLYLMQKQLRRWQTEALNYSAIKESDKLKAAWLYD